MKSTATILVKYNFKQTAFPLIPALWKHNHEHKFFINFRVFIMIYNIASARMPANNIDYEIEIIFRSSSEQNDREKKIH